MNENKKKTPEEIEIEKYTNRTKMIQKGIDHHLNSFRNEIINGLGEEIKEELEKPPETKKPSLFKRIKNLFI